MNDRELLELAAKAAGIGPVIGFAADARELMIGPRSNMRYWRPLTDDGAALRLAMQLQMTLELGDKGCIAKMWGWPDVSELCHPDPSESQDCTRRAIVRAAAQIGEVLP